MNLLRDKQNNIEKEINLIKSTQPNNIVTPLNLEKSYYNFKIINDKIFENFEKIKKSSISYSEIEKKVEELNKKNDEIRIL